MVLKRYKYIEDDFDIGCDYHNCTKYSQYKNIVSESTSHNRTLNKLGCYTDKRPFVFFSSYELVLHLKFNVQFYGSESGYPFR